MPVQNQYGTQPSIPIPGVPGVPGQGQTDARPFTPLVTGEGKIKTVWPMSGDFSQQFSSWLGENLRGGASPFNLPAFQPSSGQFTDPGQLTARMNPLLEQLGRFFQTGQPGGVPGLGTLRDMSQTGMPTDVGPAWEAMKAAQQRNIDQGAANVREQLSFAGNLAGTPYASAISDFYGQATKEQNALLGQLSVGAQESARGRQTQASQLLFQGANELASAFQQLDQQSIQATLAEFVRTRPEYGPLLNMMFALATTFPPIAGEGQGFGLGASGAALSGGASLINSIADLFKDTESDDTGGE